MVKKGPLKKRELFSVFFSRGKKSLRLSSKKKNRNFSFFKKSRFHAAFSGEEGTSKCEAKLRRSRFWTLFAPFFPFPEIGGTAKVRNLGYGPPKCRKFDPKISILTLFDPFFTFLDHF